jgi:glycosyltransferase involved in cell wall biosynthesis
VTARPRLLAFTTSYFPDVGGVEVALRQVAERLAPDFEISIVTARLAPHRPRVETLREGRIHRLGVGHRIDKWLLPSLGALSRADLLGPRRDQRKTLLWGLDITQGSLAAAWLSALEPSNPFVLTIQYGEGGERLATGRLGLIRRSFRYMLARAAGVTAISTPLADLAADHGYRGRVEVIPNGVDLDRFRRRADRPPADSPVIISVSRLVRKNGVDVLLRALPDLVRRHPNLQCRIVGDGLERQSLARAASDLGLGAAVRFLGTVAHDEIPAHLGRSSVFVRPSRSEGMGNAFLEAMAAGVPVVGTRVGGIPEIVQDGETGLLCDVDDPPALAERIERIIVDRELASNMAAKALAVVTEKHNAGLVARRYAQLFRETMAA